MLIGFEFWGWYLGWVWVGGLCVWFGLCFWFVLCGFEFGLFWGDSRLCLCVDLVCFSCCFVGWIVCLFELWVTCFWLVLVVGFGCWCFVSRFIFLYFIWFVNYCLLFEVLLVCLVGLLVCFA